MAQVRFEAFYDGIGEVMRPTKSPAPWHEARNRAQPTRLRSRRLSGATVPCRSGKDRRPEAQVRADVDEEDAWQALTVLRKAADV